MPRKKKEPELITYLIPQGISEHVTLTVDNDTFYKNKMIWQQKFYHLFEYIALQNIDKELDPTVDYVNVNMERMAKTLAVNNRQMSRILKDCVNAGLLKRDGIMKQAVKFKSGKKTIYTEQGKSYGYQFATISDLTEITVVDNR